MARSSDPVIPVLKSLIGQQGRYLSHLVKTGECQARVSRGECQQHWQAGPRLGGFYFTRLQKPVDFEKFRVTIRDVGIYWSKVNHSPPQGAFTTALNVDDAIRDP